MHDRGSYGKTGRIMAGCVKYQRLIGRDCDTHFIIAVTVFLFSGSKSSQTVWLVSLARALSVGTKTVKTPSPPKTASSLAPSNRLVT